METINNMAAAAAKVVWGEPEAQKEPISGAQGDVSKGQPYDAGNLGLSEQEKVQDKLDGGSHDHEPSANSNYTTDKPTTTPLATDAKPRAVDMDMNKDKDTTPSVSTTAPAAAGVSASPDPVPSKDDVASKPAPADTTSQQNDTRDPSDENTEVEPKGPGPRPLAVVAKEHGGDAGRDHEAGASSTSVDAKDKVKEVADDSDNKGSGEIYVKTSGLAADGGDFDATNPGAGREADRLMDEKGMAHNVGKKEDPISPSTSKDSDSKGHHKDKPSLSERIKAKLHKH